MTEKTCGRDRRENAGISSESMVRIHAIESLRFPGEGSSAQGKSEPKERPKGVADAQTVEIPSPPKDLSAGTLLEGRSQVLVLVEIEGKLVPKSGWIRGEKSCVYI